MSLRRTREGFDGGAPCRVPSCANLAAIYSGVRQQIVEAPRTSSATDSAAALPACSFGAPLVTTALQRLGIVDRAVDPASVTPEALGKLPLESPARFAAAVGVRTF
jgi:hypothetical protein